MKYLLTLIFAIMFVFNMLFFKLAFDHAMKSQANYNAYEATRNQLEGLMRTKGVVDNAFTCKRR